MVAGLAGELQRRGHTVLVVVNRHPLTLEDHETVEGVSVRRIAWPSFRAQPVAVLRFLPRVLRAAREFRRAGPRPDVIHVHGVSNQALPLLLAVRRAGAPIVVTTHGETFADANALYERSVVQRLAFRALTGRARRLTAPSKWTAQRTAHLDTRWRQAEIIPNGVDVVPWLGVPSPPPATVGVFAWGRHEYQKGFDVLLRAWPLVRATLPAATLVIGGDGSETSRLRSLATAGVSFAGVLTPPEVRTHLAGARVVVVPSRVEAFGVVAIEALAAGRRLVYTLVGGLPEVVGVAGRGVPPDDPNALALAILAELSSRDAKPGTGHAETFALPRVVDRYEALYRSLAT